MLKNIGERIGLMLISSIVLIIESIFKEVVEHYKNSIKETKEYIFGADIKKHSKINNEASEPDNIKERYNKIYTYIKQLSENDNK